MMPFRFLRASLVGTLAVTACCLALYSCRRAGPAPSGATPAPRVPAGPRPVWPWPGATEEALGTGVTQWRAPVAPDGTTLDLFRYDFASNRRLRLELYDQDEDDAEPGDGRVRDWWPRGAAQAMRHLQAGRPGRILAAWNGLFFNSTARDGRGAAHVAPVVLRGQARYPVGNHRWTVGVQVDQEGRPTFRLLHLPDQAALARAFTFAAAGAQALVNDGRPLRIQPAPRPGDPPLPRPFPSTPQEAGHIPGIDHIRTARTSFGWSKDSRQFYLLIVKEQDREADGIRQLRLGQPQSGGWDLAQLRQFWMAQGAWEAVNIDGGDVTQLSYRAGGGRTILIPPRWGSDENRIVLPADLSTPVQGGTMMYWYVREEPGG